MKKIAVLTPTYSTEYSQDFISGIYNYFLDKDVQVIIAQTKFPESKECIYDFQYWSSVSYLKSEEIDLIIVISGVYCSTISKDTYIDFLKSFTQKPIISVSIKIDLPNVYSLIIDTNDAYKKIVKHLVNEHNCKKIAFMAANSTYSDEAFQRIEAFKSAMESEYCSFDSDLLYEGAFTKDIAEKEILDNVTKENLKFDSIVCANDDMAQGCIDAFKKLGIRVPEDVKVIGFDNASLAYISNNKISTINQNIVGQGYYAAELAMKVLNKEKLDKVHFFPLETLYRHSCGCVPKTNKESVYVNEKLQILEDTSENSRGDLYFKDLYFKSNIFSVMDMIKSSDKLIDFYYTMPYILEKINLNNIFISFLETAQKINSGIEFVVPKKMKVIAEANNKKKTTVYYEPFFYNPKKNIFPTQSDKKGIFIFQPIFSGNLNYGYIICEVGNIDFTYHNVYLKILVTFLSQLYEYTQSEDNEELLKKKNTELLESNSSLSLVSKTDELTGILNRRGFYDIGQKALDVAHEMNASAVIFFSDLNGLKKINDSYGHVIGDRAIRAFSEALRKVFRKSDVIGRLSGDEFAVFANGMTINQVEVVRKKLAEENLKISKKYGFPFEISCCIGATEIADSNNLMILLNEADQVLYEEKRKRYGNQ